MPIRGRDAIRPFGWSREGTKRVGRKPDPYRASCLPDAHHDALVCGEVKSRGHSRSARPFDRGSGSCYYPGESGRRDTMARKDKGGKKVKKPKQDKVKKGPSEK
jgi:hypothetical protein